MRGDSSEESSGIPQWRSRPMVVQLYGIGSLFLGITALGSGAVMLIDPSGATMGLELHWLETTPFQDFRIPGIILFSVLGIGSLVVLYAITTYHLWALSATIGLGTALIGWIVTQVILLQEFHVLQVIYGLLGLVLLGLSLHPDTRSDLHK